MFDFAFQVQIAKNSFLFKIKCSSGTYIRSLCRDLANRLNTIAYMPLIIRSEVDSFNLENGITLNELDNMPNPYDAIIPLDKVYQLDKIALSGDNLKMVRNGMTIFYDIKDGDYYLLDSGKIFAIGKVNKGKLKMEIYLDD